MRFEYETDPLKIERESFQKIKSFLPLIDFPQDEQQVIMRIVHSLGVVEIADNIRISKRACESGRLALSNNRPILCDAEMVKQGITKRMIANEPKCFLNHQRVPAIADELGMTRSMAAIHLWDEYLDDSVVVIGNAPTALFYLLERISNGAPKPALIIGMPVGFVGAEESKHSLWKVYKSLGVECITILSRMGGSAVASATCNALLRCNKGIYF